MEKYEQMLEKIYVDLPKKISTHERFEPPVFDSFIQGKQTIIKNFTDVANTLRREPVHVLQYISRELATAGNIAGHRALLQGKFEKGQISSRLTKYIEEYVLCNECKKPDTRVVVFEGVRCKQCEVCGARSPLRPIR